MSINAHQQNLVSSSCSNSWSSVKPIRAYYFNGKISGLDNLIINCCYSRRKHQKRILHVENSKFSPSCRFPDFRKHSSIFHKIRRMECLLPFASADDGVTVNGNSQARTSDNLEEMRYKLNQSLQDEDYNTGLVQLLHDSARIFELAIKEQSSLSKTSWFSPTWLGVDKNAWAKVLSYQASVYSLLCAANEISSRGDGRDRDINVFVQRSLSRQSAPLENVIREKLLAKQAGVFDRFWSEQIPTVVTSFVGYFEKDKCFAAVTTVYRKDLSSNSGNSSDISLLMLALSCIAAIAKLGPTKVSCAQFFSVIPDITGRLMDMLVEFVPVGQAYYSIKEIGLHRELLVHFGPRAASCRMKNDFDAEEIIFWVSLVQKQLQRAIDRERIWSRLTTCESIEFQLKYNFCDGASSNLATIWRLRQKIESHNYFRWFASSLVPVLRKVLERDLAVFGFFIALGRSTQSFLFANGFENMDEPIEGLIRYLIGGSVLYYPQLSAISSYQLYVEVVCEELDWLPFYPGSSSTSKPTFGNKHKDGPPNTQAIPVVLDVCSHWIQSFIKYSKWLENPSNVKAARFLSKGHEKLKACMKELGIQKIVEWDHSPVDKESESFDKALESVEGALLRLEELLQELHLSSSRSGKEHLKAACSDLERIRRLKKEAEFLEASFRAKAASLQQSDDVCSSATSTDEKRPYSRGKGNNSNEEIDRNRRSYGLWNFFDGSPAKSSDLNSSSADESIDEYFEQNTVSNDIADSESKEIQRFELLRSELMELEKRVQESTNRCVYDEEETQVKDCTFRHSNNPKAARVDQVQKKDSIINKSLDKLKETSMDVLQGTQLLAVDVVAAMDLLRRSLIGDELAEKEKQALRRTLTDLASVVPIGFLMLLPVTAVGHAAMLAAIQRYAPALIPSTYGHDRLDLLRKVEKVKELEEEASLNETSEE